MTRPSAIVLEQPVATAPAVAVRIADFLVRTEVERLHLFRMHLAAVVRTTSPLLPDLAAHVGVDLAGATALIHPPQDWPWRPVEDYPPALRRMSLRQMYALNKGASEARAFERSFANPGVIIRGTDHPEGRFAIRPAGSVMGFTAAIGPCILSAFGSLAMLRLEGPIPEALMMSMPGRTLGHVVDHPVFRGRDYMIRRAVPDLADGRPVLEFRARLVPFAMPLLAPVDHEGPGGPAAAHGADAAHHGDGS